MTHPTKRKKGRRLKKPFRILLRTFGAFILFTLLFFVIKATIPENPKNRAGKTGIENFRDLNEVHLRYARKKGITPMKSSKELHQKAGELMKKGDLVQIDHTSYYVVDRLTHSHPYLVPEAADLLEQIGERFHAKLAAHQKDKLLFKVTSLLRTGESQKRLSRMNGNASSNSAHLYATTFDITYKNLFRKSLLGRIKVTNDPAALHLLSETIGELRKEKKLVVVTEKKEACFHITAR
jgi:hypothetical protein